MGEILMMKKNIHMYIYYLKEITKIHLLRRQLIR